MSSSIEHEQSSAAGGAGWLEPHRDAYLAELGRQNYAAHTIARYKCAVAAFVAQADLRGVGAQDIDEAVLAELRGAVPELRSASEQRRRQGCIARFIGHLVDTGVIDPLPLPPPPVPESAEELSAAYGEWLRHQQGLGTSTIRQRRAFLRRFVTFRFGAVPGELDSITPEDVQAFLDLPSKTKGGSAAGYRATPLRSLFRFLFATGRTRRNLVLSVPRLATPRSRGLSRHLPAEAVRQLIASIHDEDGLGRRNYAMLLLMARLGLRAEEVIAIRLDDINWAAADILIRGKGMQYDRMPLPADVGEGIVAYVLDGRVGDLRHLFVTWRAPHRPFSSSLVISRVLHEAFARTGLKPPEGGVRSHLLRHSLAVDMLGRGASLDEVSDVLRHRSRETTTNYARYDIEALRSVARPWPVPGEAR